MFKGHQKVSLIDYPGKIATTVFTGGCNFWCAWCHNWGLVEPTEVSACPNIEPEEIKDYLDLRKGKVQAVCVTGGEPTLWEGKLESFFEWCKSNGYSVKLDTNGYRPETLRNWIKEGLLDFIAMDIKNSFEKYAETAGLLLLDTERIRQSISIIKTSGLPHQFRTTVVPGLVDPKAVLAFGAGIGEHIVLQEFRENLRALA